MEKDTVKKLTRGALLLAIMLLIQLAKNLSAYISGPVVNTVLITAAICIGLWYGIVLSVIAPITSMLIAPASPMTQMTFATNYANLPIIIIGNIILVLFAYFFCKKGNKAFAAGLILGSVAKWLFMWGGAELILKPLFAEKLGKLIAAVSKVFSTLQLYSALAGSVISYFVVSVLKKTN